MKKTILISIAVLTLGGLLGWNIYLMKQVNNKNAVDQQPTVKQDRKVLYWYDPMKPDQHFDKPGKSPYMDMELLPKYEDEHSQNDSQQNPTRFKQAFNVRLGNVQADNQQRLWVPSDAVLLTGKKAVVFVYEDNGYLDPIDVQVGETKNSTTQIIGDINAQQQIVLSASFLIDAESNVDSELAYMRGQNSHHD